jgi:zinc protease
LLSRVLDRGTENRSADDIAEELENRGAALTIGVTRHQITLSCTCLTEDFEPTLALLAEIVSRPTVPNDQVEIRRGEVLTLLRQDADNPAVRAVEKLMEILYGPQHPYGRRAKGTAATLEALGRDDLLALHRARFAPATLSLVIVGDVSAEHATRAAAAAFDGWSAAAPPPSPVVPVPDAAQRQTVVIPMMNKSQVDVAYGFTAMKRADPAYYALWIMNNILGQYGLGGRLGDSIRERQGMAYYAFSSFDANVMEGPLLIRAGVNPANVDRTVQSIDEEVDRMATSGVSETELVDAKRYLIGSIPRTLETNAGIAAFLQAVEHFNLGLDFDQRLPELLGGVTREQVAAAAQRTLSARRAAVVVAGPYSEG